MENIRQIIKIRVVKNAKYFIRYTSRPSCVNWKIFENNLAAIHEKKISLTLSKPMYVGFTVLEITKWEIFIIISWSENLTVNFFYWHGQFMLWNI